MPTDSQPSAPPGLRLVFGATGYVGSHLLPRLLAEGVPVRAAARDPSRLHLPESVERVRADALDPDTLGPALEGVDTAYYLVHSMAAGPGFGAVDRRAARNFAAAAAEAGVRRIVYLGGLVPAGARSEHVVSRRETGEILRQGSVPVTELRAGIIVGPGSAAFEVMRDLVLNLPVMFTPRWVRAKSPPIALDNLLHYLVRLPELEQATDQIYDAGGPEDLSYQEMMRILARAAGQRPPRVVPLPVLSPKLSAYWLRFVTSVPTPIAQALVEGLRHDFTANDEPLRRLVPQRLLNFRESVAAAFDAERHQAAPGSEGDFNLRGRRHDHAFYAKRAGGSAETSASPAAVWRVVSAIGGDNRYYYLNSLWTLREVLDTLVGGSGRQHRRRHPTELREGDPVDSWEVLAVEPERRLLLGFGMKAPGSGALEILLEPQPGGGTRITATAHWHPAGSPGLLYWYALAPAHLLLFDGLTREIGRRAERLERDGRVGIEE